MKIFNAAGGKNLSFYPTTGGTKQKWDLSVCLLEKERIKMEPWKSGMVKIFSVECAGRENVDPDNKFPKRYQSECHPWSSLKSVLEKWKQFLLQTRPARNCKGYVGRKKEKRVRERSDYLKRKTPFFNNHLAVLNPFMCNFLWRLQIVYNNSKIMTYWYRTQIEIFRGRLLALNYPYESQWCW